MKLKKLHEAAAWHKLNEQDFRSKTTTVILNQQEAIDNLNDIITELSEDIQKIKRQINIMGVNHANLISRVKANQGNADATHAEQNRSSRPVSPANK